MRASDLDAYVLCGGLATRLRGALGDQPKALAAIGGRPFLDILLAWLRRQGVERFVLCAGHRAGAIEQALPALAVHGPATLCVEPKPLGTGGGLRHALAHGRSDPFLALNGDSLCAVDLPAMLARHLACGAGLTLTAADVPDAADYGAMRIDDEGRVRSFSEKNPDGNPGLVNAGVYLVDRDLFASLAPEGAFSLERDLFPRLAGQGLLHAWVHDGPVVDIGTPERYLDAGRALRELGLL